MGRILRMTVVLATVLSGLAADPARAARPPASQPGAVNGTTIGQLIADLGSKSYPVRESAQKRLVEIGPVAWKALRTAARTADPEIQARARAALEAIRANSEATVKELGLLSDPSARPWFSPDGQHLAHVLKADGKQVMVYDNKQGPAWDDIMGAYSRAGRRYCYRAQRAGQGFVAIAGEEDAAVVGDYGMCSPDGNRFVYVVHDKGEEWVVCDGRAGPRYRRVSLGPFSRDGNRLAYQATDANGSRFIVLDGKPLAAYESVESVAFSPEGSRVAYVAKRAGRMHVVCDGKEGQTFDNVFYPLFSPDGKSLAYWTRNAGGKDYSVVRDEVVIGRLAEEPMLTFSPDSRRVAWGTWRGSVYVFEKTLVRLESNNHAASRPVFSPDGRHLAYALGKDMKWGIRVDGNAASALYEAAGVMHWDGPGGGGSNMVLDSPAFSSDGRHLFFVVMRKAGNVRKFFLVCDGIEMPPHDDVWVPPDYQSYPQRLRYVVRDGNRIRLVEAPWPHEQTWRDALAEATE